ncbi:M12 family metallopeptidase [Rheinheimera sp. NSM]|uniref:M12 family metallopeptidase n=1 Tax=Rheinheimera sp. NSM TaxID=3457884 RepID=UPI004035EFFD
MKIFIILLIMALPLLARAAGDLPDTRQGVISLLDNDGNIVVEYVSFVNDNGTAIFEGDIVLGDTDVVQLGNTSKKIETDDYTPLSMYTPVVGRKWPSTIPYAFNTALTEANRTDILGVMRQFEAIANIRFVPRSNQRDYLHFEFTSEKGVCGRSYIGKQGGKQNVWLKDSCIYPSSHAIFHEILHALGFFHEHTRPDRDDFITVHWNNISSEYQVDYNKLTANIAVTGAYDYSSVMHYRGTRDGKTVLSAKSSSAPTLGGYSLSLGDINGLIEMYGETPRVPYVSRVAVEWVGCTSGWHARGLMEWTNLGSGMLYQLEKKQGYHWYRMYTGTSAFFTVGESVGTTVLYRVRAVNGTNEGSWLNLSQYVPCRSGL